MAYNFFWKVAAVILLSLSTLEVLSADRFITHGAGCRAVNPGASLLLQSRESGLLNTQTDSPISIVCPISRQNFSHFSFEEIDSISLEMGLSNSRGNDVDISCVLTEIVGLATVVSTNRTKTLPANSIGNLNWTRITASSNLASSYSVSCELPSQVSVISIQAIPKTSSRCIAPKLNDYPTGVLEGLTDRPFMLTLPENTTGTLSVGLSENSFGLISFKGGYLVAATSIGLGRVVVFSGQDFIGSQDRSTLLGNPTNDRLIANAIEWSDRSSKGTTAAVLVDNQRLADVLVNAGYTNVSVTSDLPPSSSLNPFGGTAKNWSSEALADKDVAIIQINEWGGNHLDPDHINAIRQFVTKGGGLLLAGSMEHWSWWLSATASEFPGDLLLEGTELTFNRGTYTDLSSATLEIEDKMNGLKRWCDYVNANPVLESDYAALPGLFSSAKAQGLDGQVSQGLERLIAETPELPAAADNPVVVASHKIATTLDPHEWPEPHPWAEAFPGLPIGTAIEEADVMVDVTFSPSIGHEGKSRLIPLGYYAPPGKIVTVNFSTMPTEGFKLIIGESHDNLIEGYAAQDTLYRAPWLYREFEVNQENVEAVNAFGGSIYLKTPQEEATGELNLKVSNAIPMMVYTRGLSEINEWSDALEEGMTPNVILQDLNHIRLVLPLDPLEGRWGSTLGAKGLVDPDTTMDFWSQFHQYHEELAQEPNQREFESHWIFDSYVGWGLANASDGRINNPVSYLDIAMNPQDPKWDFWLFAHELGHQFQTSNWTGGDITEVAVNLFSIYTLCKTFGGDDNGGDRCVTPRDGHPDLSSLTDLSPFKNYRWSTDDLFERLELYRILVHEFGWMSFKQVFASYYSSDYSTSEYGEYLDGFAIRMSYFVERDLSGYFQNWEYPLSDAARRTIKEFGYDLWLPAGW